MNIRTKIGLFFAAALCVGFSPHVNKSKSEQFKKEIEEFGNTFQREVFEGLRGHLYGDKPLKEVIFPSVVFESSSRQTTFAAPLLKEYGITHEKFYSRLIVDNRVDSPCMIDWKGLFNENKEISFQCGDSTLSATKFVITRVNGNPLEPPFETGIEVTFDRLNTLPDEVRQIPKGEHTFDFYFELPLNQADIVEGNLYKAERFIALQKEGEEKQVPVNWKLEIADGPIITVADEGNSDLTWTEKLNFGETFNAFPPREVTITNPLPTPLLIKFLNPDRDGHIQLSNDSNHSAEGVITVEDEKTTPLGNAFKIDPNGSKTIRLKTDFSGFKPKWDAVYKTKGILIEVYEQEEGHKDPINLLSKEMLWELKTGAAPSISFTSSNEQTTFETSLLTEYGITDERFYSRLTINNPTQGPCTIDWRGLFNQNKKISFEREGHSSLSVEKLLIIRSDKGLLKSPYEITADSIPDAALKVLPGEHTFDFYFDLPVNQGNIVVSDKNNPQDYYRAAADIALHQGDATVQTEVLWQLRIADSPKLTISDEGNSDLTWTKTLNFGESLSAFPPRQVVINSLDTPLLIKFVNSNGDDLNIQLSNGPKGSITIKDTEQNTLGSSLRVDPGKTTEVNLETAFDNFAFQWNTTYSMTNTISIEVYEEETTFDGIKHLVPLFNKEISWELKTKPAPVVTVKPSAMQYTLSKELLDQYNITKERFYSQVTVDNQSGSTCEIDWSSLFQNGGIKFQRGGYEPLSALNGVLKKVGETPLPSSQQVAEGTHTFDFYFDLPLDKNDIVVSDKTQSQDYYTAKAYLTLRKGSETVTAEATWNMTIVDGPLVKIKEEMDNEMVLLEYQLKYGESLPSFPLRDITVINPLDVPIEVKLLSSQVDLKAFRGSAAILVLGEGANTFEVQPFSQKTVQLGVTFEDPKLSPPTEILEWGENYYTDDPVILEVYAKESISGDGSRDVKLFDKGIRWSLKTEKAPSFTFEPAKTVYTLPAIESDIALTPSFTIDNTTSDVDVTLNVGTKVTLSNGGNSVERTISGNEVSNGVITVTKGTTKTVPLKISGGNGKVLVPGNYTGTITATLRNDKGEEVKTENVSVGTLNVFSPTINAVPSLPLSLYWDEAQNSFTPQNDFATIQVGGVASHSEKAHLNWDKEVTLTYNSQSIVAKVVLYQKEGDSWRSITRGAVIPPEGFTLKAEINIERGGVTKGSEVEEIQIPFDVWADTMKLGVASSSTTKTATQNTLTIYTTALPEVTFGGETATNSNNLSTVDSKKALIQTVDLSEENEVLFDELLSSEDHKVIFTNGPHSVRASLKFDNIDLNAEFSGGGWIAKGDILAIWDRLGEICEGGIPSFFQLTFLFDEPLSSGTYKIVNPTDSKKPGVLKIKKDGKVIYVPLPWTVVVD